MSMEEIVELDDLLHKEIMYASNNDYFTCFSRVSVIRTEESSI